MKDNYVNLCTFNFGKHNYVVMKNSSKVMYFESVDGNYVMPITSFSLYDNEGKSLTVVNQNFFMSQLINRLNIAFKKGIFLKDQEFIVFLNGVKNKVEIDLNLKKLFKGSFMKEIDEENFESNKKQILRYLDGFKFDNFVNYNNVSIFEGSLEKSDVSQFSVGNSIDSQDNEVIDIVDDDVNVEDVSGEDSVDSNSYFSSLDNSSEQNNFGDEFASVSSNDYFSQFDAGTLGSVSEVPDNSVVSSDVQDNSVVSSDISDNSVSVSNVVNNDLQVNDQVNSSLSYIDEVKNRINSVNSDNSNDNKSSDSNFVLNNVSVVDDKPVCDGFSEQANISVSSNVSGVDNGSSNELEKISAEPIVQVDDKVKKEKANFLWIFIIILLIVVLVILSIYLCNYVF